MNRRAGLIVFLVLLIGSLCVLIDATPRAGVHLVLLAAIAVSALGGALFGVLVEEVLRKDSSIDPGDGIETIK